ncbi:MAG: AAA family ATPase [Chloroflexi bacterium]|nr:AAA family ATPase [Chloroflexota bacterium]
MTNEPRRTGFIGRQPELAVLTTALDEAMAGRGQMVMLAGEPGIGKTRLAEELTNQARALGSEVLWGWCYEHAGAPPYWPYVHPIRNHVESAGNEQLRAEMGSGAGVIAEIVPELNEKLPDLAHPATTDPEQARFRLFDSVATFLKNASFNKPLVFVLDDLHWADSSSLLMLEFLVREISGSALMILGTYRDVEVAGSHPLSKTLGNLVRERHFRRIQLDGLTRHEVGEFVESSKGVNLPNDVLQTIHSRTEGNPLFVNEVVQLIDPDQMTENRAWADIIPEGVRDAVGRRLSRLSENCNQVLRAASVIGREFDISLLSGLDSDLGADGVLVALEEALEARVIEALPGGLERYQFGHALIQQVLYEEMSPIRRVRAHARVGETLEQLHRTALDEHAAELAYHFAEAEAVLGPGKSARYWLMAGERALSTFAHEDALAHFERGLAAREISVFGSEAATDDEAAALLFGFARAKSTVGVGPQLLEAFSAISRAFEFYASVGNIALAVATAEFPISPPTGLVPGVAQLIDRALTLVPPDSHEAGRLLSRFGGAVGLAGGDYLAAQKALGRATAIANREGDTALEVQTLAYAADVSGNHLKWQESVNSGRRAIQLGAGYENTYSGVLPRWWALVSLLHMGDLDGARAHYPPLKEMAERSNISRFLAWLSSVPITFLSCVEGDWASGRENSDHGLAISPRNQQIIGLRAMLEYQTGETDQGEIYLDRLIELLRLNSDRNFSTGRSSMAIAEIARITGVPNHVTTAKIAVEEALLAPNITPPLALHAKAALAMIAVQEEGQSAAAMHYGDLQVHAGTMLWTVTSLDRLLGRLSRTINDLDQSASHFDDAVAFCRKAGYHPELAWTCCDYADTLLVRNGEGDHGKAIFPWMSPCLSPPNWACAL